MKTTALVLVALVATVLLFSSSAFAHERRYERPHRVGVHVRPHSHYYLTPDVRGYNWPRRPVSGYINDNRPRRWLANRLYDRYYISPRRPYYYANPRRPRDCRDRYRR